MRIKHLTQIILIFAIFNGNSLYAQQYSVTPVPFSNVTIKDAFWTSRQKAHEKSTLQACIAQVQDSTARINNFEVTAGVKEGKHEGKYYDDSDVYKVMEGIAYSLALTPNSDYEAIMDRWIDLITASQMEDGYLNTYYQLNDIEKRWTKIGMHEMYCAGHMIEGAIAYYKATGKKKFLDAAIKFADHLINTFGPEKRHWVTGHEEIELALVKLYYVTKEKKYLDMAYWLLEERGHGYYRPGFPANKEAAAYMQDDVPVSEITDVKGHAVRAMYLYSGMTDVAAEKHLAEYLEALKKVWESVVYRNMYITGGIGSSRSNEGFMGDYFLPNKTAYCETCASIGMVFWNHRMNMLLKDAKYADVLERSLYNLMSGISLEGSLFFYANPLESDGDYHRTSWFSTACCPSNMARFIPSVGNYIYLTGEDELFVNLYIGSETDIKLKGKSLKVKQKTNYPWDGKILLELSSPSSTDFTIYMRIPEWCQKFTLKLNGEKIANPAVKNGYIALPGSWGQKDKIELILDMPVKVVSSDPQVKENIDKRAIQRGPLVYCMEETDNKNVTWDKAMVDDNNSFKLVKGKGTLKDMVLIKTRSEEQNLVFIPYFAWDNREPGKMKVWIDNK